MNLDLEQIWLDLEKYEENKFNEKEIEIQYISIFAKEVQTFQDLQPFLEKWDMEDIKSAAESVHWLPVMEASEDDELDETSNRSNYYGNTFVEVFENRGLQHSIWSKAKPKRKKFF